jgi:hypothetical protein
VKGRIKQMQIRDALEGLTMPVAENDITCALWLISIAWKNDSNLIVGSMREIVSAMVTGLIEVKSYLALLFWRQVPGELMCLLIHLNGRMVAIGHVLEGDQSVVIEVGIPFVGHPKVDCISWIINVQLSINQRFSFGRKKRTSFV